MRSGRRQRGCCHPANPHAAADVVPTAPQWTGDDIMTQQKQISQTKSDDVAEVVDHSYRRPFTSVNVRIDAAAGIHNTTDAQFQVGT